MIVVLAAKLRGYVIIGYLWVALRQNGIQRDYSFQMKPNMRSEI